MGEDHIAAGNRLEVEYVDRLAGRGDEGVGQGEIELTQRARGGAQQGACRDETQEIASG